MLGGTGEERLVGPLCAREIAAEHLDYARNGRSVKEYRVLGGCRITAPWRRHDGQGQSRQGGSAALASAEAEGPAFGFKHESGGKGPEPSAFSPGNRDPGSRKRLKSRCNATNTGASYRSFHTSLRPSVSFPYKDPGVAGIFSREPPGPSGSETSADPWGDRDEKRDLRRARRIVVRCWR